MSSMSSSSYADDIGTAASRSRHAVLLEEPNAAAAEDNDVPSTSICMRSAVGVGESTARGGGGGGAAEGTADAVRSHGAGAALPMPIISRSDGPFFLPCAAAPLLPAGAVPSGADGGGGPERIELRPLLLLRRRRGSRRRLRVLEEVVPELVHGLNVQINCKPSRRQRRWRCCLFLLLQNVGADALDRPTKSGSYGPAPPSSSTASSDR